MKHTGRNIRGLLLCAALVLLLAAGAITSGQAETPKPGDLCPYCGIGTWRVFSHGPTEHLLECSYSGCEYTSYGGDKYIVENHYGGQTCGPIAYCEVCGNPYSAEPLHDFGPWEPQGPGGHVRTCRREGCGYQEMGSHRGGEATCKKGAVCIDCGFEYTSPRSHIWSDWKPATRETHSRYCRWDGCDARETVGHSGGSETCVKGAVCKDCGFEYTRPLGHDWSDEWVDNGKGGHDRFCRRMGCETFWEGKPEPHTGGKATCVKGAVCVVCNTEYTAPDEENHDWSDWTSEGNAHMRYCRRDECGEIQRGPHTRGSDATCEKGTVCKECGAEYTAALGHEWVTDYSKGLNGCGWDWAQDGSSATAYLKCRRVGCEGTAECTDSSPAKADNGTGWTFTATVTKDGKTFTDTYTVDKPVLTITAIPQEYVYNGKTQGEGDTVYATAAEIAQKVRVSGLQGGDELIAVTIDGQGDDAGVYELVPSNAAVGPDSAANKRYNIVYVGSTLTISKKPVTVWADDLEKTEGEKDPELTATVTGLLDGDTLEYTLRREKGEAPGKYTINITAKARPNYEATELPGTLTIRAKQAEPTAAPTAAPAAAPTEPPAHTAHHFVITDVTITRIRYRCDGCGISLWKDNVSSRNAIPGLMKDEEGEDIDYTAGVTREDGKRILTVTPEQEENDVRGTCLRLKPADLEAWKEEGLDAVRLDRNGTILEIDPEAVPGEWFGTEQAGEKPDFYVFRIRPADGGMVIEVSMHAGEETIPADALEGITLKTEGAEIPVTMNGTWPAEDEN